MQLSFAFSNKMHLKNCSCNKSTINCSIFLLEILQKNAKPVSEFCCLCKLAWRQSCFEVACKFLDHIFSRKTFLNPNIQGRGGDGTGSGHFTHPLFCVSCKPYQRMDFFKSVYPVIKMFHEFSSSILNFQKKLGVYKFSVLVVHHHFKVKLMCTPTGTELPWLLLDYEVLRTIIKK